MTSLAFEREYRWLANVWQLNVVFFSVYSGALSDFLPICHNSYSNVCLENKNIFAFCFNKEALLLTFDVACQSSRANRGPLVSDQIENIDMRVTFWWKSKFIIVKNVSSDFPIFLFWYRMSKVTLKSTQKAINCYFSYYFPLHSVQGNITDNLRVLFSFQNFSWALLSHLN